MKNEHDVRKEMERLFIVFMDPKQKKPIRDDAFVRFHALNWVIEDEEDIIKKRLREIHAGRTKETDTK